MSFIRTWTAEKNAILAVFNVPAFRIRNRLKGTPARINSPGHGKKLSDDQELALVMHVSYIGRLDDHDMGLHVRERMIQACGNSILKDAQVGDSLPLIVGPQWVTRFLDRNKQ